MCGLLGTVGVANGIEFVNGALDGLSHRGPDDRGVWADSDGTTVLGHRRLSIIDLSDAGHQPMSSPQGDVVLALNGEIYNYRELRRELAALGHGFRSDSDTEVLLHAYLEWGRSCTHRLVGMYAFALFDGRTGELWLCRDPFGIKPLFVVQGEGFLAFASEIPPLLDLVDRRLDLQTAYDYLRWGHVDRGAATFVERVTRLGAGESLVVHRDRPWQAARSRHWTLPSRHAADAPTLADAAVELRRLLTESIELHLRADVPVGSALSGGIDSSGVVMLMRAIGGSDLDLHTFSFLAPGEPFDESPWVATVRSASGAHGHDVTVGPSELPELLASTVAAQCEPFGSLSIVAQHAVFRAARRAGVPVLLDGQGADELFAGYPSFRAERLGDLLRRGRLADATRLARRMTEHDGPGAPARAVARALPPSVSVRVWRRWMQRSEPAWLDSPWFAARGVRTTADAGDLTTTFHEALDAASTVSSLPGLLRYEDRNSMAWSVESRVPYLTTDLAAFAATLPPDLLVDRAGNTKAVLVAALRGLVPDAVLDRRDKVAFQVPQTAWLPALRTLCPIDDPASLGLRAGATDDRRDGVRALLLADFVQRTGVRP